MTKKPRKRGRPPKPNAKSAAERMRAYRKRKRDAGLVDVRRWIPAEKSQKFGYSDHQILDARSLAMHCKIAQKISHDPRLLEKAKANLSRWRDSTDSQVPRYLDDWQEILESPWPEIAATMTSMNENATRLRSSSPFAGLLSEKEREQIYAAFRA